MCKNRIVSCGGGTGRGRDSLRRAKQEKGKVGVKEKSQTVTLILGFEE